MEKKFYQVVRQFIWKEELLPTIHPSKHTSSF